MDESNRKNVAILSFTLVVVTLGYGMVIPLFPFYIEKLGASGWHMGLLVAVSALLELIFGPIWGSLSDRTGRKPILLLGLVGYALSSLLFGLSTKVWMLFASRALSGALSSATMATALAYISDSTSEEDRGGGMGMLGAAAGLGIILGPGFGGWLGRDSIALPFFVATGFSIVALLLAVWKLPESLPLAARTRDGQLRTLDFVMLWHALSSPIGLLLFLMFLVSFGLTNFESIFGLYAALRFDYGPERVGMILAVIGVVSTVGKAVLIGPLTKRWGEVPVIKVSLLASSIGFIILLLAVTYPAVLLATGVFILTKTLLRTVIIAMVSKQVVGLENAMQQGMAMGLCNSFMNLGRVVGPIWAGYVFDISFAYPYVSGALIMFVGFLIALFRIPRPCNT